MIRHIDLFSGIGGFALATEWAFGEVKHTFVDNDYFCQQVLKKHWPNSEIYGDIRKFIADTEVKRMERKCGKKSKNTEYNGQNTHIVTGGFPCQPFSQAGRRKGTADNRYLWPEMFRVIQLYKPEWVIAENVRGLTTWNNGMVLEQVCTDLESEGYEVQPLVIPAVAVNAPHRRDRVWIVANATSQRRSTGRNNQQGRQILHDEERNAEKNKQTRDGRKCGAGQDSQNVANTGQQLRKSRSSKKLETNTTKRTSGTVADKRCYQPDWNRNWREVALTTCHDRMDDGLSKTLVRLPDGNTISRSKWRKEALKAYGNAIVPQVAYEIMKNINLTK